MKKIGFLSFGHWSPSSHSLARSASDVLLQSIDLAVAAEQLGADGAFFRVHISRASLRRRFRCWRLWGREPAASRSARPSLT
jgi:alkanesulfonate monooxygenase SsuD/methylene tetrahydromethanopterin reductase-like flavin-dependent oxidoreductase (luciferase family)